MPIQPLTQLPKQLIDKPIIFVGGKGGVGKTTTAGSLACYFASQQHKTLIISTDPAHSLGDVLDVQLSNQATQIHQYLYAIELNPDKIVDEHFVQVERTIKSYANPDMLPKIQQHLRLSKSAPGAVEAAMLEAMCRHLVEASQQGYQHIIFDTAPTGHTLRLLVLPEMMSAWTDGLLAQQRRQAKLKSVAKHLDKHRQTDKQAFNNPFAPVVQDKWSQAVEVLEKRKKLFRQAGELLHDDSQTAIVLVMIADNLPLAETKRAVQQLKQAKLTPTAIVINQLIAHEQTDPFWQQRYQRQQALIIDIISVFQDYPLYPILLQQTDIIGFDRLKMLFNNN